MSNLQRLDRAEDTRAWARESASSFIHPSIHPPTPALMPLSRLPHPAACICAACATRHLHIAAPVRSQTRSIRRFHSRFPIPCAWSVSLDGSDMMAQRRNHRPSWWNPIASSSTPNLTSVSAMPIRSPQPAPSASLASIPIVDSPYRLPPTTRPLAPSSITAKTWNLVQTRSTCATVAEINSQPPIVCSLHHLFPMQTSPVSILLAGRHALF
ncbi:hypothetical protein COCMIDRAFT_34363 [Bipolaris oryzae ATCC 44560]|uniref:Uncharacterized protein n=1 Tax=Bipolaris oryzae ATCC 44560 TaxID=930090 RepID=W6ZWE1_COCMI|nr:uncharacterized protein COCMIDRAFT_34363 [Bipolaris oryzae ATCC 44560]EUC48141.1 hypothetical protein COCMIDRAFT_34363 [Bipolaris oryzae ATCC 44560]